MDMLHRHRMGLVLVSALCLSFAAQGAEPAVTFEGASWIWTNKGNALKSAPAGTHFFRTTFTLPDDYQRERAEAIITCDNLFVLHINGAIAGENTAAPNAWNAPQRIDISRLLVPGVNCVAIEARNTVAGPAGLLAKVVVFLGADQVLEVATGEQWRFSGKHEPNWVAADFEAGKWQEAKILAPYGTKPWGRVQPAAEASIPLDFEGAEWIWSPGPDGRPDTAKATRYFRFSFSLPKAPKPAAARAIITCDNLFDLSVNGKWIGASDQGTDAWRRPKQFDVGPVLREGTNVVAVKAENILPGAAGLILRMLVKQQGRPDLAFVTNGDWKSADTKTKNWQKLTFDDGAWHPVVVIGTYGVRPWGKVRRSRDLGATSPVDKKYRCETAFEDPIFQDGIVFVRGYLPLKSHHRENFMVSVRGSRAYTELDTPTPVALGRQLLALTPFRPDGKLTVLCDAQGGVLGAPVASYTGQTVYFAMAPKGDAFFHLYRVNTDGTGLEQITAGPFHDYDPVELPDGRIAFSSTRIGNAEEYHAVAASSIFACNPDGTDILPLTSHIVSDREPRVTATGSIVFVRSDNFLERAKVEVHVHETHLDGTNGAVIIGPGRAGLSYDRAHAAESNGAWLRRFGAGSPAPTPDGRTVAISQKGLVNSAVPTGAPFGGGYLPYDLSPLPDGRLLCTDINRRRFCLLDPRNNDVTEILAVGPLELPAIGGINQSRGFAADQVHSVQHLAARRRPDPRPSLVRPEAIRDPDKTGYLYCQNVFNTQQNAGDVARIRAVRVFEGRPFSLVPTKSIYVHIGTEGVELGTVPVAPDGSFYVRVPADRALTLQAVDGEGRAVISEMSWIYVRPGERRACVGCHAPQTTAPTPATALAAKSPPLALLGQGAPHRFRANNGANGGIFNLQLDRFREAANVNLFSRQATALRRADDHARLLQRLKTGDAAAKTSAAQALGILRDSEAAGPLIDVLTDPSPEVRNAAALALAAAGGRLVVPALQERLSDKSCVVAQAADVALRQLTGAAVDFNAFAGDRQGEAGRWQQWLAAHPLESREAELIAMLAAEDLPQVYAAVEGLARIGGDAARSALRQYLGEHPGAELRLIMAVIRALGRLRDKQAVPVLAQFLGANVAMKRQGGGHEQGRQQRPVYLAATAAEALGRIGTPEAEEVLKSIVPKLVDFSIYTFNCGEHTWLMGCHSSVLHYRILEAFDRMGTTDTAAAVPAFVRSIPIDKDRGLIYELDGYETLTARMIIRSGRARAVTDTCLSVLGDTTTAPDPELVEPVSKSPHAQGHIRIHSPQARAAQVLSIVCRDPARAAQVAERLEHYTAQEESETRSWVCFFLLRTLGHLGEESTIPLVRRVLVESPKEAELGLNTPPVHWPYKAMKPFFRAAAAYALGELGARETRADLLDTLSDLDNAPAVRREAAIALGKVADRKTLSKMKQIAANYPEWTTRRHLFDACRTLEAGQAEH